MIPSSPNPVSILLTEPTGMPVDPDDNFRAVSGRLPFRGDIDQTGSGNQSTTLTGSTSSGASYRSRSNVIRTLLHPAPIFLNESGFLSNVHRFGEFGNHVFMSDGTDRNHGMPRTGQCPSSGFISDSILEQ